MNGYRLSISLTGRSGHSTKVISVPRKCLRQRKRCEENKVFIEVLQYNEMVELVVSTVSSAANIAQ